MKKGLIISLVTFVLIYVSGFAAIRIIYFRVFDDYYGPGKPLKSVYLPEEKKVFMYLYYPFIIIDEKLIHVFWSEV